MNPLMQLRNHGQSYWLDDLTRQMIASGELARRIGSEDLRGVTSNPSIFAKALQHGDSYAREIADAAAHGENPQQIYEELVTWDVRSACDLLRPVMTGRTAEMASRAWRFHPTWRLMLARPSRRLDGCGGR